MITLGPTPTTTTELRKSTITKLSSDLVVTEIEPSVGNVFTTSLVANRVYRYLIALTLQASDPFGWLSTGVYINSGGTGSVSYSMSFVGSPGFDIYFSSSGLIGTNGQPISTTSMAFESGDYYLTMNGYVIPSSNTDLKFAVNSPSAGQVTIYKNSFSLTEDIT